MAAEAHALARRLSTIKDDANEFYWRLKKLGDNLNSANFPCVKTDPEVSNCQGDFDCQNSYDNIVFRSRIDQSIIDPNSPEFTCALPYRIELPWTNCQGDYALTNFTPLTSNNGTITFAGNDDPNNPTVNYLDWDPVSSTNDQMVTFNFGAGNTLCTIEVILRACEDVNEKTFPSGQSSSTLLDGGSLALPNLGGTLQTAFDTTIRCIANGRHTYSRRLATNADNTKLLLSNGQIYNISSNPANFVTTIPLNSESVWSMTDPNLIYGVNSATQEFQSYNCSSGVLTSLGPNNVTSIGSFEGQVSANGIVVLGIGGSPSLPAQLQVWDIFSGSMLGTLPIPGNYDNASVSNDGSCIFVHDVQNLGGGIFSGTGTIYTTPNLNPIQVPVDVGHGDFAKDCNGDTVFAYFNNNIGRIQYINCQSGVITTLNYGVGGGGHLSGNNCIRDGIIYGSFYNFSNGQEFIGAVELCPGSNYQEIWAAAPAPSTFQNDPDNCAPRPSISKDAQNLVFTVCDEGGVNPKTYIVTCD